MYTLPQTEPASVYTSVLKSDCYQLQHTLEKLKAALDPESASRTKASKRRSEIAAIRQGSEDVEKVLQEASSGDPAELKLKLTELMNSKMVEVEALLIKEIGSSDNGKTYEPSKSRLAVWLDLVKWVQNKVVAPSAESRPPSNFRMQSSVAPEPPSGLEKQVDTLEARLANYQDAYSSMESKLAQLQRENEELEKQNKQLLQMNTEAEPSYEELYLPLHADSPAKLKMKAIKLQVLNKDLHKLITTRDEKVQQILSSKMDPDLFNVMQAELSAMKRGFTLQLEEKAELVKELTCKNRRLEKSLKDREE